MVIGSKLYRTKECANSMAWAKEHIIDAPDGSVFLADTMLKARGRQDRVWKLYPGQLLLTLLLKPKLLHAVGFDDIPVRLNQLNMAISVGIAKALEPYGVGIKWPNDFVVGDNEACLKKIGGLLAHVVWQNNFPAGIIIGFGINVNTQIAATDDLYQTATSLAMATGKDLDMRAVYHDLLEKLDRMYTLWEDKQFSQIYRQWKAQQVCLGKKITIHQKDGAVISGVMSQVLPNGDMLMTVLGKVQIIPFCIVSDVQAG